MTTQAHTPAQTLERYYNIARHYRDETRADLKRTQAATDSLVREVDAASATHCAMLTGAYRNAASMFLVSARPVSGTAVLTGSGSF